MHDSGYEIPNDPDVSSADIEPEADLTGADLSEADLREANLSGAELREANLSEAFLSKADLSGTNLLSADFSGAFVIEANLSEANLVGADLIEADLVGSDFSGARLISADLSATTAAGTDFSTGNLQKADLSEAVLTDADFSEADLTGTDFGGALLWNTSLSDALVSRKTSFSTPEQRLRKKSESEKEEDQFSQPADRWDAVARANNELRSLFSDNGLINQAREARVRERRARRKEAKADKTLRGTAAWLGSLVSRWTTGYGVKMLPVIGVMLVLFFGSAVVYLDTGMGIAESLYYSAVTFTTSPPSDPEPGLMRLVAGIETFLGTTMIVFLGYVLGAREQV